MKKKCKKCGVSQSLDCFDLARSGNPIGTCKECRKLYYNAKYKQDEKRREKIRANNLAVMKRNVQNLLNYFSEHPCVDCGETDPVVLEFDHVRGKKKWNIATRTYSASRWETILQEIEKCDVRCANCHRRKTAERAGGWYKIVNESERSVMGK